MAAYVLAEMEFLRWGLQKLFQKSDPLPRLERGIFVLKIEEAWPPARWWDCDVYAMTVLFAAEPQYDGTNVWDRSCVSGWLYDV